MSTNRDSISSTTSRFSTLLSSSTVPIPSPQIPTNSIQNSKRISIIYDKPLSKTRGNEISLGAWEFLFSEIIQYTQRRVSGIGEFEKRLNILGYRIGSRLIELLPLRESLYPLSSIRSLPPPTRIIKLLPLLSYIHGPLYKYLFNKTANSLEKSTEAEDEFMIGDNEMMVTKSIQVPKEMSELSCGAVVAGIIEAILDGAGFPARVTAHSVPTLTFPKRTIILIKLDASVLTRESAMGNK